MGFGRFGGHYISGEVMRDLTSQEKRVIEAFARRLPEGQRKDLLADLSVASVLHVLDDGSRVVFSIAGYKRPPVRGQHAFPVEGRARDLDGAKLSVVLYADENHRLLELELIRFDPGSVRGPDWTTLEVGA